MVALRKCVVAAIAVLLSFCSPALAAAYLYNYVDSTNQTAGNFTFVLPNSTPSTVYGAGLGIGFDNITVTNSITHYSAEETIIMPNAANGGALYDLTDDFYMNFNGAQLFSITNNVTTLATGSFRISRIGGGRGVLTVSVVPEAATWMMMVGGFVLVGGTLRSRSNAGRKTIGVAPQGRA